MAFCHNCGTHLADGAAFCANCGAPQKTAAPQQPNYQQSRQQSYQQAAPQDENSFKKLMDTPDHTKELDPKDIEQNNIMAIFCYLGLLLLIPLFAVKNSRYCRFHANQGLVSLIISVAISTVSILLGGLVHWVFDVLFAPVLLAVLALEVLGIVYAIQGKARELPIIGKIKLLRW